MADTGSGNQRLQTLKQRAEALQQQIARIEAADKAKARKEDTRLKVIVGAAVIANSELHPETRGAVVEVLRKAVTAPRDREFLKSKGWL
jgi:septal ring factor EnvC (AmiA/AmiB activator)